MATQTRPAPSRAKRLRPAQEQPAQPIAEVFADDEPIFAAAQPLPLRSEAQPQVTKSQRCTTAPSRRRVQRLGPRTATPSPDECGRRVWRRSAAEEDDDDSADESSDTLVIVAEHSDQPRAFRLRVRSKKKRSKRKKPTWPTTSRNSKKMQPSRNSKKRPMLLVSMTMITISRHRKSQPPRKPSSWRTRCHFPENRFPRKK